MTNFVLVHGAWHGGWCWQRVARRLRAAGHEAYAPTLTGLGERAHLVSRQIDLDAHIEDIVGVLRAEELTDVVLCGHSYGGMVISGVADRVADRIAALVYLDAYVPSDGQSLSSLQLPERRAMLRAAVAERGAGWLMPPIPAVAFAVNDADHAWVDRQCVPHPYACFEQPIRLTGAGDKVAKRTYIQAVGYAPSAFGALAQRLRGDKSWRVESLPCGHDVMVDMPDELAALLIAAA
jgi:pimeloyl-ACP methyl ester carboxylesterase